MCGITAIWAPRGQIDLAASIRAATSTLADRGPDGEGVWIDPNVGVALGHRRLAVIDLTEAGRQPMLSRDGRFCITFNGEIYNFRELRDQLRVFGHEFNGQSDTEVMLAAFQQWGVEAALSKFIGMFAFALWDRQDHRLFLCRDRFGKKPLYFGWLGNCFAVASQLKAFTGMTGFRPSISRHAFSQYAAKGYVPTPLSIYERIYKLSPGSFLSIDLAAVLSDGNLEDWILKSKEYWNVSALVACNAQQRYSGSEESAASELLILLNDAVRIRMIADVPIGAFLSGGIDSSLIVALMQRNSSAKVKTYTVGYADARYDESDAAESVAQAIGSDHTAIRLSPDECQQVVPLLSEFYDEPFADASAIPTLLVSRFARKEVTVVLSGDGADELFGGYNRHFWLPRIWRSASRIPHPLRSVLGHALGGLTPGMASAAMRVIGAASGSGNAPRLPGDKMAKAAAVLHASDFLDAYNRLTHRSNSLDSSRLTVNSGDGLRIRDLNVPDGLSDAEKLMYLDMVTYLVDDVMVKVDRATMAYSLEARAPFLDHRVAEFAWTLPSEMKVQGVVGKRILRRLRTELIPSETADGPKMGFSVPIGEWLRGPLREWASELLDPCRVRSDGFFDADVVASIWDQHLKLRAANEHDLWRVLMFNSWLSSNTLH
jgi:asparagine synthase (glutamine-hydrolysing)